MGKDNVMLLKSCKRRENIESVQHVLTEFGCIISTRIGLHEAGDACSNEGLIILHLVDKQDEIKKLEKDLKEIEGVTLKIVQI